MPRLEHDDPHRCAGCGEQRSCDGRACDAAPDYHDICIGRKGLVLLAAMRAIQGRRGHTPVGSGGMWERESWIARDTFRDGGKRVRDGFEGLVDETETRQYRAHWAQLSLRQGQVCQLDTAQNAELDVSVLVGVFAVTESMWRCHAVCALSLLPRFRTISLHLA